MTRIVEAIKGGNGKYGVIDNGIISVDYSYEDPYNAILEWAFFEKNNLNELPHRRYLDHVTSIDDINERS